MFSSFPPLYAGEFDEVQDRLAFDVGELFAGAKYGLNVGWEWWLGRSSFGLVQKSVNRNTEESS